MRPDAANETGGRVLIAQVEELEAELQELLGLLHVSVGSQCNHVNEDCVLLGLEDALQHPVILLTILSQLFANIKIKLQFPFHFYG